MTDCQNIQAGFEGYAPLKLEVMKRTNDVLIYAGNQSKSIILVKRIILGGEWVSGGRTFLYNIYNIYIYSIYRQMINKNSKFQVQLE